MPYNPAIAKLQMPERFKLLPVDERGFPVPKFVAWIDEKPDFRVIRPGWLVTSHRQRLCWLCGQKLGTYLAFVIGPMCAINRVNSEPPSHLECALFAARGCPFLTQPKRKRNLHDLPDERKPASGVALDRNPGVALVWVTKSYQPFKAKNGTLFRLGDPITLHWFAHGRTATRDEILASIDSGIPILRGIAELEGASSVREFEQQVKRGLALVPAA